MKRDSIAYQALLLGIFASLSTILLVVGNAFTHAAIEQRRQEDLQLSLREVLPAEHFDNSLVTSALQFTAADGKPLTVYRGSLQGKITACVWEIRSDQGYSGTIRLLLAVNTEGAILGVRVIAHAETPGLGDKIEANKSDWVLKFNGLSLGNPPQAQWKVKKDGGQFDSFSGATITPRAVVQAIENGLLFFRDNREALLQGG